MLKTTIYLSEELYERIRRLAEASGKTQSAIIREALVSYTSAGPRKPRSVGMGRSGMGDLSERAEELLEGMGTE